MSKRQGAICPLQFWRQLHHHTFPQINFIIFWSFVFRLSSFFLYMWLWYFPLNFSCFCLFLVLECVCSLRQQHGHRPLTDVFQNRFKIFQHSQENTCGDPCRPSFAEHLQWLLLDFRGSKYFFQLNLVFIADSRTGFCTKLLWKHDLNLRSSNWNSSLKKVFLEILQISQENTSVEVSL